MAGPDESAPLARRRVLVVEDEYFLANDLVLAIEKLGAEVVGPVQTRDKALALLNAVDSIDAAVLTSICKGKPCFRSQTR